MVANPEASAISEAYTDQIKALYKVLFDNFIQKDAHAIQKFKGGLELAQAARDAALKVVGATLDELEVEGTVSTLAKEPSRSGKKKNK